MVQRIPRPAARILLVDQHGRLLMFRFTPEDGRPPFWCTPGGAVDPGETYEEAARRELYEETGIIADPGPEILQRTADFLTIEGVEVTADERYFRVDIDACDVSDANLTAQERRLMAGWRWFSRAEIAAHDEIIYPVDLIQILDATEPKP
jgi:8-oxo-dGTP pyrophosphatase MutT (NUDIX family)